jgi:ADP-ribosylglycohydrolase
MKSDNFQTHNKFLNEYKYCRRFETYYCLSALFGVAVGDVLDVPVEFEDRDELRKNPVTGMIGGDGTAWDMPAGTWSDDSSLTFCLAESLTKDFDLNDIVFFFVQWLYSDYWTAGSARFDVGVTTANAIQRLAQGVQPDLAGNTDDMYVCGMTVFINEKAGNEYGLFR